MLSRRTFFLSPLAVGLLPAAARAEASPEAIRGASQFIQWLADQAIAVLGASSSTLETREAEFRRLLSQGFAMPFIGRFVLGRYWRTATPEQREDYQELFAEYILRTYSSRLGGYAGETFNVTGARPAGKQDILVATRIDRPSGPAIKADWRVRVFDNEYKIIDIMVEGVSMAVTQRSEFTNVVRSQGFEGLLQALRARTERMPAAS